jgi:hypothetical protein
MVVRGWVVAPFVGDDDAAWWSRLSAAELAWLESGEGAARRADEVLPALPPEVLAQVEAEAAAYSAGEWIWSTEPDCTCEGRCLCETDPSLRARTARGIPTSLAAAFEAQFRAEQGAKAAAWRAAVVLHDTVLAERGPLAAEHVGAELAVRMGVHPRTGMQVLSTALRAVKDTPRLVELMDSGCLSDRHVSALLDEVGKWTDNDTQARLVLDQTLDRCVERADRYGWPTPGELKRILQRVALLNDLRAADKRRKTVAEQRGVSLWQAGPGAAGLTIEGPEAQLALAYRAIAERAEAMQHLEGDTRTREQREYDAALELLTIDADMPPGGGVSARPTIGLHGEPLELVVRGAHVAMVMPYSVAIGGDLELAEIPGLGYILPSTARQLLEHADTIHRVAVDAATGQVLAVDDAVPGPNRRPKPQASSETPAPVTDDGSHAPPDDDPGDEPGDGPGPEDDPPPPPLGPHSHSSNASHPTEGTSLDDPLPAVGFSLALLRELADRKVIWRDLNTSSYRVPSRLRRLIEHRDRTCRFPGCTVPGTYCDVDHRDEWPRGGTHADNCHLLCRRHHRAKQFYFADVTLDPTTGDTCWTTYEGTTYRRPPPRY